MARMRVFGRENARERSSQEAFPLKSRSKSTCSSLLFYLSIMQPINRTKSRSLIIHRRTATTFLFQDPFPPFLYSLHLPRPPLSPTSQTCPNSRPNRTRHVTQPAADIHPFIFSTFKQDYYQHLMIQ